MDRKDLEFAALALNKAAHMDSGSASDLGRRIIDISFTPLEYRALRDAVSLAATCDDFKYGAWREKDKSLRPLSAAEASALRDEIVLTQALHDPENQPSQYGTIPIDLPPERIIALIPALAEFVAKEIKTAGVVVVDALTPLPPRGERIARAEGLNEANAIVTALSRDSVAFIERQGRPRLGIPVDGAHGNRPILRSVPEIFDSTADERIGNNLSEEQRLEVIQGLEGDDVALSFKKLTEDEKQAMFGIKVRAQRLIDFVRALQKAGKADPAEATLSVRAAQTASHWGVGAVVKSFVPEDDKS